MNKPDLVDLFLKTDTISPINKKSMSLVLVSDPQGNSYIPVFTSVEQYRKWNIDKETLQITLPGYQQLLENNPDIQGIVINPFDHGFIYETNEVLQAVKSKIDFAQNESVRIGIPDPYPSELTEYLSSIFAKDDIVQEAYLVRMQREINNEESYLLVLDALEYDESLCQSIAALALPFLEKGEKLDFIMASSEFGSKVIQNHEPFYKRSYN